MEYVNVHEFQKAAQAGAGGAAVSGKNEGLLEK